MKKRSKILALLLVSAMTLTAVPATTLGAPGHAAADETVQQDASVTEIAAGTVSYNRGETDVQTEQQIQSTRDSLASRSIDWNAIEGTIREGILFRPDTNYVDLSEYKLQEQEVEALTDAVLVDVNAEDMVETTYVHSADGTVKGIGVSRSATLQALTEEVAVLSGDDETVTPGEEETPGEDEPTVTPTPGEEEPTVTPEPTEEPTVTPEPTEEPTVTPEPTEEPTVTPEPTEEPTVTPEPTEEPTVTPEPTEEPTVTPEPTEEPTVTPEPTEAPEPTPTQAPIPTPGYDAWTDEQKQEILGLYLGYQQIMEANPNIFGLQVPYNNLKDTDSNPLGAIFTMMASQTGDDPLTWDVATMGYAPYDQIFGAVAMFYYAAQAAVDQMGTAILAAKDEALAQLDDSMTTIQKLLTLNDWLANHCTFDMYSMMGQMEQGAASGEIQSMRTAVQQAATLAEEGGTQEIPPELAEQIPSVWQGNHVAPLAEGHGLCVGYANAYAYLIQWAFPEIYKNADGSWKTAEELNTIEKTETVVDSETGEPVIDETTGEQVTVTTHEWDPDAGYIVDYVRITYDADITMFGMDAGSFNSSHYWNAVKVDGEWYYIDPCYTDIYIECMMRDRVETDGNMTHLYFMVSDTSVRSMYDGNYKDIDTSYQGIATDQTYESAWFSFARSPISTDGAGNYYYFYDSTDTLGMLDQMGGMMGGQTATQAEGDSGFGDWGEGGWEEFMDTEYKLVMHDGSGSDSENTYTALVDFTNGQVLDPASGQMVDNQEIADLYALQQSYEERYPSIGISGTYYEGKFYFSIANCVMSYDMETGAVTKLKEYNEVSASRTLETGGNMGGMGFTVVPNGSEDAQYTVHNNPIASMTIKNDGKMYVSVATNFGYISGKEDFGDTENTGYAFEETNYNPNYNAYFNGVFGEEEINDNDEFMFSANFVDTIDMDHFTGSEHTYEQVTAEATCDEGGFTENRCTECGLIEADTRANETEPTQHHFQKMDETYYTKDDAGNFNTGTVYVCPICKTAVEELEEGQTTGHSEYVGDFHWSEDLSSCTADVKCAACGDLTVDCIVDDPNVKGTVECKVEKKDNGCEADVTATATFNGQTITDVKHTDLVEGGHVYGQPEFNWSDDYSACEAVFTCTACGDKQTVECTITREPDEDVEGYEFRTATCTFEEKEYSSDPVHVEMPIELPFTDINSEADWYYGAVEYVYRRGIMTGMDETTFGPYVTASRAQFATMLYRLEGEPAVEYDDIFPDVPDEMFFTDAVIWAQQEGIITGYTDGPTAGLFGTSDDITREQVATILYRYAEYKGYDLTDSDAWKDFPDSGRVSEFAQEGMAWAVNQGIITGKEDTGTLEPTQNINRAEIATMIMRFMEKFQ